MGAKPRRLGWFIAGAVLALACSENDTSTSTSTDAGGASSSGSSTSGGGGSTSSSGADTGDGTDGGTDAGEDATDAGPAATPLFSPPAGNYANPVDVTLSSATPSATIHYTLDDTDPTEVSPVYTTPIPLGTTTTIRAVAMASGRANSPVAIGLFNIK
jgi:hypothetical protein